MIKGITVILYERTQTGADPFGRPVETETPVAVANVLPAPVAAEPRDPTDSLDLTGRREVYDLFIPKGDDHIWVNRRVDFFGKSFRTFGPMQEYVAKNVPGLWNRRIRAERFT